MQYSYGIFVTGDISTLATNLSTTVSNLNVVVRTFRLRLTARLMTVVTVSQRLFYSEIAPPSA